MLSEGNRGGASAAAGCCANAGIDINMKPAKVIEDSVLERDMNPPAPRQAAQIA
jgi:hypothetical protein